MKVGLVGVGNMGSKYVNKFNELMLDYVLVDSDIQKLNHYPPNIKKFTNIDQAMEEGLDAVFIATSPQSHIPLAKVFLNEGINVMVEKPPSLSRRDFEEALDLAYKKNVFFSVSEIELKSSSVRNLYINEDVGIVEGYRLNLGKGYINPFFDLAWHDLYIFSYLFGNFKLKNVEIISNIAKVEAVGEKTDFILEVAWLHPYVKREWNLKTSQGNINLNFVEDKITYPSGKVVEKDNQDKLRLMIKEFLENPSYESSLRSLNILKEIENFKL